MKLKDYVTQALRDSLLNHQLGSELREIGAHHQPATRWWRQELLPADDRAAFCRVTQLGLLRLLTNDRVMGARCRLKKVCRQEVPAEKRNRVL